jgi:hypothetical protein
VALSTALAQTLRRRYDQHHCDMSDKVVELVDSSVIVLTFPPLPRPDIFDSEGVLGSYELKCVVMVV